MTNYITVNLTKEHHEAIKTYMTEKGIKSFDYLLWKAFEQYTRKR